MLVRLTEAPLQEATVGLGFKTDEGVHGTLEHQHRRAFGLPATARNRFELSGVRQAWEGELSTHTLPGLYRHLIGGGAERLVSDDDVVTSANLRLGRAQNTKDMDRLVFVQAERSLRRTDTARETSDALSLHYHGVWRQVDDNLLPTRGHVYSGQLGAGVARSSPGESGPFGRAYAQVRGYWPIGAWFASGRVELGQVFARDGVIVPESMRFRAGGDNSVRGYGYRELGLHRRRPRRRPLGRPEARRRRGRRGALPQPGRPAQRRPGLWRGGAQGAPAHHARHHVLMQAR